MNILVCVKRVPDTGAKLELESDQRTLRTRHLGFTISPHEECAVEEAVRIISQAGGEGTVLTLGPPEAEDQLREALARGMSRGILLETDGSEWAPEATAQAIAEAVTMEKSRGVEYDLLLFGNEAADTGDYQVGIRVAHALDLPCVTSVKALEIGDGEATAKREIPAGWEVYQIPLPAVVSVKEGINLPRHPSLRGTLEARRKPVEHLPPTSVDPGLILRRLKLPADRATSAEILGEGPTAVPRMIEVLEQLELL